jgi:hypothetical protein
MDASRNTPIIENSLSEQQRSRQQLHVRILLFVRLFSDSFDSVMPFLPCLGVVPFIRRTAIRIKDSVIDFNLTIENFFMSRDGNDISGQKNLLHYWSVNVKMELHICHQAGEVILVREDIDIRLLDYFYFSHSEVEKANSLVVIEEETESGAGQSEEKHTAESNEKH